MITLSRNLVQQLLAQAQAAPLQEICGLLVSDQDRNLRCVPMKNIAEEPETQFEMAAEQQLALQTQLRDSSEALYAIYHSHPTAPAVPSAQDIAECGYPELLYLIISLNTKGVLELRGWKLDADEVTEVPLRI